MKKIYIASPYTLGDVAVNIRKQIDAAEELMNFGFLPIVPLYSHFHQMIYPHSYQHWMNIDFELVKMCDCLLRLEGESKGADQEVELANKLNIPVFNSIREVKIFFYPNH